jgi:hypothetical protein
MKTKNNFDSFFKHELRNSSIQYDSDRFKNQVLTNLPQLKSNRNLIIYLSGILSCVIFSLTIDIQIIKKFLLEIYQFLNQSAYPSFETIVFFSFIVLVLFIIPRLEFKYGVS